MIKENTLIYRAQTGDEEAFAGLMRAYHTFVYAIVIGVVNNPHDAEEIVQDTFFNAYQGLKQLEDAAKFDSWLAEIARNCARQWLRKQRGETVPLDEVSEEILQTEDSPDERLTRLEQRELIRRTMETLPQKDRDIARAFYLDGASYDELTSAHGLSYNAIAFRLSRAKRQLSKRLQYLLTGIFVSPGVTLKKLYSGGLTVMKIGTVPKITVSAAALVALIFIGYIGVRQINSPAVEERVYLSPWEDGTSRPQNSYEDLVAQTDTTQDTESGDTQPQIATAESAEEKELIDDLFAELDEMDLAQFATEGEFEPDAEESLTADTSVSSESANQSAEDVMYAYVEAFRDSDFEAMSSLGTEEYMRSNHGYYGDGSEISVDVSDDAPDDVVEIIHQFKPVLGESIREATSQAEVVSSEHVGDEFHFRLRTPAPEIPNISSDHSTSISISPGYQLVKMRKENSAWRVYDRVPDYDSMMSEMSKFPH